MGKLTAKQREVLEFASCKDDFASFEMYKIGMRRYMQSLASLVMRGMINKSGYIYYITGKGRAALGIDTAQPEPPARWLNDGDFDEVTRQRNMKPPAPDAVEETDEDDYDWQDEPEGMYPDSEFYEPTGKLVDPEAQVRQANAQIAALKAEVEALRAALKPFAELAEEVANTTAFPRDANVVYGYNDHELTVSDFKRAAKALNTTAS